MLRFFLKKNKLLLLVFYLFVYGKFDEHKVRVNILEIKILVLRSTFTPKSWKSECSCFKNGDGAFSIKLDVCMNHEMETRNFHLNFPLITISIWWNRSELQLHQCKHHFQAIQSSVISCSPHIRLNSPPTENAVGHNFWIIITIYTAKPMRRVWIAIRSIFKFARRYIAGIAKK